MDVIEQKLEELWKLLQTIPEDCKGEGEQNSKNRYRFLKIRIAIHGLMDK